MMTTKKFFESMMEIDFTDLPEDLVSRTRHCILDAVGSALFGAQISAGQSIIRGAKYSRDDTGSTIVGSADRISTLDAYRVNARLSNLADFGEGSFNVPNHPGRMLVHSGLVAGDKLNASLKDTTTAIIVGYETILRVGHAIRPIIWPFDQPQPD
ncbi:MAG: MmgE/PrpD family protein, partial [Dehalococcoidales bacterium]